MTKKIYLFIFFFLMILIFFLSFDFILSKYTNLFQIRKDCFNYIKIEKDEKKYYTYFLSKNCHAFEHKSTTPSYKVYTDNNGNRYFKNKKEKNLNPKIIFLGDSFAYGFGLNYNESIPGIISKKVNNEYDVLNFAVPGYSPSMNYYKLKQYLDNNKSIKISKIIYLLDLTDVHDEANRWKNIKSIKEPVIADQMIEREIKKSFDFKKNFRATRFFIYHVNNYTRNFKKFLKNKFFDKDSTSVDMVGTYWGSFTHTSQNQLSQNQYYLNLWKNDFNFGLTKINNNIKKIAKLSEEQDAEFYISIHPWRETIELGQAHFNWEKYSEELCNLSNCKKIINFFDKVREIKEKNLNWKTKLFFKNDLHFNREGNQLYSEKIFSEAFK